MGFGLGLFCTGWGFVVGAPKISSNKLILFVLVFVF